MDDYLDINRGTVGGHRLTQIKATVMSLDAPSERYLCQLTFVERNPTACRNSNIRADAH